MFDTLHTADDRFTKRHEQQLKIMATEADCDSTYDSDILSNVICTLPGRESYWESDYLFPNEDHPAGTLHITHPTFEDGAYGILVSDRDDDGDVVFHVVFSDTTDHVHRYVESAPVVVAVQHLFEMCLERRQSPSYSDRISMFIKRLEGLLLKH